MNTIQDLAASVIDAAGQAGGIEEVRRIAEEGWPEGCWSEGWFEGRPYSAEERDAIQARARQILAEVREVQS